MDKRKSVINVSVSIFFKIILAVGLIVIRRFLIKYVGNEVNGLNSLYLSIVGFLAVAELGVGGAITFCMYKPIVDGDKGKVAALYQLFKKAYLAIGGIIFIVGVAALPALPFLAKDYASLDVDLYLTFFLMLVSVVLSYMFSAKTSLINAYKDNYITTTISSCGMILQYVLQIVTLVLTRSFVWYLVCRIVAVSLQWIATELCTRVRHKDIISYDKQSLDVETKGQLLKNIKAMFMHRIGGVLVLSADSMIISAFIGVVMLGKYSNYTTIVTGMTSIITLLFTPLTSIIGHMFVSDAEETKKYYNFFYTVNFAVGFVFFLGYYAVIDDLIILLFGTGLEVSRAVSFVITVNYFVQFMRQATLLFKDATGTFYNDRWKPLFEGLINVILSIAFVVMFTRWFGEDFGIVGVIVATIITNLTICHIVEPYVLYKHAFNSSVRSHYLRNYTCIAVFIVALTAMNFCLQTVDNVWTELLVNGCISILFSFVIVILAFIMNKDFRYYCKRFCSKILHRTR